MSNHETSITRIISLIFFAASALAACGEEQVLTTTRNLERPGPLAMVCAGRMGDAGAVTGMGRSSCTSDAGVNEPAGSLYGFVANTSRGEVAVFRPSASGEPLIDLDRSSPGFGFIPVGHLPTDLAATSDGCRVVSANSGSCDLSLIDVPSILKLAAGELQTPSGAAVSRLIPRTAAGPLRSAPHELVIIPAPTQNTPPPAAGAICSTKGAYRAYVTFPRCNLVAEMDLATGMILQGVQIGPSGFQITSTPVCPVECTLQGETRRGDAGVLDWSSRLDSRGPDRSPRDGRPPDAREAGSRDGTIPDKPSDKPSSPRDAGPADNDTRAVDSRPSQDLGRDAPPHDARTDDKRTASNEISPLGLAFSESKSRLYVSSAGTGGFIAVIDVNPTSKAFENPRRIPLYGGVSTTRIKLSPPTKQLGQFLYAIASDRSIRVISTELEKECETNLDLAKLQDGGVPLQQGRCFVVGDPATPPRRVTAKSSGLSFGVRIPQDVVFINNSPAPTDAGVAEAGPAAIPMNGVFAFAAMSDGTVYIIDVEDWNVVTADASLLPSLHLPHRVRNAVQGLSSGVPDASITSISGAGGGGMPVVVSKEIPAENDTELPGQGIYLRGIGESVTSEWNLVYEDRLVSRWSGNLTLAGQGMSLSDYGFDFCGAGVMGRSLENGRAIQHGDIVSIVGCKDDTECGLDEVCVKPVAEYAEFGLCLEESRKDELFKQCISFLRGKREFLVTRATENVLSLDALPTEPQTIIWQDPQPSGGCKRNEECRPYFLCAIEDQPQNPRLIRLLKQGECFRPGCQTDEDCLSGYCVSPLDGAPPVCAPVPLPLEVGSGCQTDADCRAKVDLPGTCEDDRGCGDPLAECRRASTVQADRACFDRGMYCAEFPGLNKRCVRKSPCFAQLLRYEVLAGRSFVLGGYHRMAVDPATRECRPEETESPLLVDRIPIGLPIYPVLAGPICKAPVTPLTLPEPNPCFERSQHGYEGYTQVGGGVTGLSAIDDGPSTVVRFSNPDLWLSLGVSHMTAPPASTVGIDAGISSSTKAPIPMPERGLTITLGVNSGYARFQVNASSEIALPARLAEAPDGYVYLVDMGERPGLTGTRGQVIRLSRESATVDTFLVK